MAGFELGLLIGSPFSPLPAPAAVMGAVRRVEVQASHDGPSGFQVQLQTVREDPARDLLRSALLRPFQRVIVTASTGLERTVLVDGLITHLELAPGRDAQPSLLTVTGEDLSVAMSLIDYSTGYECMPDSFAVLMALAKYAPLGIVPEVVPNVPTLSNLLGEVTLQQAEDDRTFVRRLAARHGYLFSVRPGPTPGLNQAYWGPPLRLGAPQPALTVEAGTLADVESIRFEYDALRPQQVFGMVQDTEVTDLPIPILAFTSGPTRLPPLAAQPAILADPLGRKSLQGCVQGQDPVQALVSAQAQVDLSTDEVVRVEGEVDSLRYGHVLRAPGLVGVRGAGEACDGLYYVKAVTHELTPTSYRQRFTLTREGFGSTVPAVRP